MNRLDPTRRALLLALLVALGVASVLNVLGVAGHWNFAALLRGELLFFSFAVCAAFAVHLGPLPFSAWPRELLFGALAAAVLSAGDVSLGRIAGALGYYALVRRALLWWRAAGDARLEHLRVLADAVTLTLYGLLLQTALELTATLHPVVLDPLVYAAESGFGFQPSEKMGAFFRATPALFWFWGVVYTGLPLAMGVVHAAQQRKFPGTAPVVLRVVLSVAICGYCIYLLFPLVGPFYVREAGLSLATLPVEPVLVPGRDARNCMPSLHVSWALVLFFQTLQLGRAMRIFGLLFLVATAMTTLGFEFHYLIDLIVAAPFAVAVDALGTHGRRALPLAGIAAVLVTVWLVVLRFAPAVLGANGWLLLLVSAATIAAAVAMRRRALRYG